MRSNSTFPFPPSLLGSKELKQNREEEDEKKSEEDQKEKKAAKALKKVSVPPAR